MRTKEEIEAYLQRLNAEHNELAEKLNQLELQDGNNFNEIQRLLKSSKWGDFFVIRGTLKWVLGEVVE